MKQLVLVLCTLIVTGVLVGCREKPRGRPVVRNHAAEDETSIFIEAENFTGELEPPMTLEEDPDASGGKCIHIEGGSGTPGKEHPVTGVQYPARYGAAVYKFTVKTPGKYRFWGRKFWEDGCGNSWTLLVNGRSPVIFGQDGSYGHWEWIAATVLFDLPAGENVIEVLNREDGVKLDKFVLTTHLDFVPQGKE